MDMSLVLEALLPSLNDSSAKLSKIDETTCGTLCQHPACWASIRRQQKGIARTVSPTDVSSDDSDSELDLPKQSICNLLGDYGENTADRYPLSTGGRPSHQWEPNSRTVTRSSQSIDSFKKLTAPHNTKGSLFSKSTSMSTRRGRVPLIEVQEVFDKTDLNSQWDETFVTKQYYMWVPNPKKSPRRSRELEGSRDTYQSMPVLMKDLTEIMVPSEIEQKREDTIIFDEWPVLKKKHQRSRSPPARAVSFKKVQTTPPDPPANDLDTEGINELLALPKDALMRVLEHTKKSDFTSKGKLRTILQEYVRYDERARMALNAHELFQPRKMPILKQSTPSSRYDQSKPPIFHMDDEMILDRMSSVNTPVKDKETVSDAHSVGSFPRYKKPLPKIQGQAAVNKLEESFVAPESNLMILHRKARIPAISLGLPELPSGVKTTKAFSYTKKSFVDFSLGPVISPPSTVRSSLSGDYSEHGTTLKVHAPSTAYDERVGDQAIHSVSPSLSTHVPDAPAVTPATFMSPTKSAPAFRDYKELSRDPSHNSISLSQKAMPPSRDVREVTALSSMPSNISQPRPTLSPLDTKVVGTPDDLALDTINETAREAVDGSIGTTSHQAVADDIDPGSARKEEMATLALEPSALTSIHTSPSPMMKTARSVESCPSPEQWPLISELSFENMPRPSVSEPAFSARNRNLTARSLDDDVQGTERDFARRVLDEKITAESPAPPPPSPEPKDHEHRSRKDLKSRDSLSMAPLFEVSEVEEGSPIKEMEEEGRVGKHGEWRMKQVRQIHAIIPQAKVEHDKKEESDDNDDVMVSQITVTHVKPKGPDPKVNKGEKVQETFLNVDIPAEEISSLKAEHGSSHQEDISSNDTVVQSVSTATGSQVSALVAPQASERKEDDESENENVPQKEEPAADVPAEESINEKEQITSLENDAQQRENSAKQQSEDSVISPELVCDSARFLNHELVSPVEGELEDDLTSRMLPLLNEGKTVDKFEEDGQKTKRTSQAGGKVDEVATRDSESQERNKENEDSQGVLEGESVSGDVHGENRNGRDETSKKDNNDDIDPPGSFFFRSTPSSGTPRDETGENKKTQEEEINGSLPQDNETEETSVEKQLLEKAVTCDSVQDDGKQQQSEQEDGKAGETSVPGAVEGKVGEKEEDGQKEEVYKDEEKVKNNAGVESKDLAVTEAAGADLKEDIVEKEKSGTDNSDEETKLDTEVNMKDAMDAKSVSNAEADVIKEEKEKPVEDNVEGKTEDSDATLNVNVEIKVDTNADNKAGLVNSSSNAENGKVDSSQTREDTTETQQDLSGDKSAEEKKVFSDSLQARLEPEGSDTV